MSCNRLKAAVLAGALVLASCSQPPKPAAVDGAKETAEPAVPVSGKTAFWEMYKSAYAWARDATPLALESKKSGGVKDEAGNFGMWSATFGSLSRREARTFSYSVVKSPPDIYKGVTIGKSLPWSGPTREALHFQTADLVVDSDAAYKTASAQAAPWLKKHPGVEASLTLGNAARFHGPVWYVLWGDKKTGYSVYVDSKSGVVVK